MPTFVHLHRRLGAPWARPRKEKGGGRAGRGGARPGPRRPRIYSNHSVTSRFKLLRRQRSTKRNLTYPAGLLASQPQRLRERPGSDSGAVELQIGPRLNFLSEGSRASSSSRDEWGHTQRSEELFEEHFFRRATFFEEPRDRRSETLDGAFERVSSAPITMRNSAYFHV